MMSGRKKSHLRKSLEILNYYLITVIFLVVVSMLVILGAILINVYIKTADC